VVRATNTRMISRQIHRETHLGAATRGV